jgi:hypothetical protein
VGNRWRPERGNAVLVPVVAVLIGVGLLIAGLSARGNGSKPSAGAIPSATSTRPPTDSASTDSTSWAPVAALTIPVGLVTVTPARSPSGLRASVAGNPIAGNPIPIRLVQLMIPTLGVSAAVIDEGVAGDGQLQIPSDPKELGRWIGGAEPGEPYGSTVIAGHVDNTQEDGALFALHQMKVGQRLVAVGADGRTITYQIVATREVAKATLVTSLEPFQQNVPARLVVVTCGGAFDASTGQYADNVVVFAVPVDRP